MNVVKNEMKLCECCTFDFGGSQSFGREFGKMEKVDEEDRRILNVDLAPA